MNAKIKFDFLLHFLCFLDNVQFPFKFFDKMLNKSDSKNHQPVVNSVKKEGLCKLLQQSVCSTDCCSNAIHTFVAFI